jgi:hypothetical protein
MVLCRDQTPSPKEAVMRTKMIETHPEPRMPVASSVPATDAELKAASNHWERRGLLDRLVRRG